MKSIPSYFEYLFDIKPNEISKSLVLQLYIFILITTLLIVKPTINSIFLTELGTDSLPVAYLLTALAAIFFSYLYNKALNHFSLKQVISFTLYACVGVLSLFSLLLFEDLKHGYWLYIPYVFVAIYGLLTTSQFWLLSNLIFNIRQAKRVFGFIGAGAIAGGIFGGYLASILTNYIWSEFLLIIAACLLFICIPINHVIWKKYIPVARREDRQKNEFEKHPIRLIKKSNLLTYMTYAIAIGVIIAKLVDYQYSHFATERLTNTDDLTSFFGFWFSTFSIISLIIQFFLTQKIIQRIGVGKALVLLPFGILLSSILLIVIPELWVVVLIKLSDGSLKQSVNKASIELLSIPIPVDIKKRTKIFTDVVVDSIATGVAGLLLIFIVHGLSINTVQISYFTISLIIIWLFVINRIDRHYLKAIKNLVLPEEKGLAAHNHKVRNQKFKIKGNSLKDILTSGSESQLKYVLNHLDHKWNHRLDIDMLHLLQHPSNEVKQLVVHHLYYNKSIDATEQIYPFLNSFDPELIIEAAQYIIHKIPGRHPDILDELTKNCSHSNAELLIKYAAANEFENDNKTQKFYHLPDYVKNNLSKIINQIGEDRIDVQWSLLLEMIGLLHLKDLYHYLSSSITHENDIIAKGAIKGMGFTRDPNLLPDLLKGLLRKELKPEIQNVIQDQNPIVLKYLTEAALNYDNDHNTRIQLPEQIEHYEDRKSIRALLKLIEDGEYGVSVRAIDSLLKLSQRYPNAKINKTYVASKIVEECKIYKRLVQLIQSQLQHDEPSREEVKEARNGLINLLEHRLDTQLERIFKLVGIRYPNEELNGILKASVSADDEKHTNAIEFIDNLVDHNLKEVLFPVIDAARLDNSNLRSNDSSHSYEPIAEYDAYEQLLRQYDSRLKHSVLHLLKCLESNKFAPLIESACNDADPSVRHQAEAIRNELF